MFKDVTSNAIDIKTTPNQSYEGYFIGSKDIETKIGPQVIFKFKSREKKLFNVYGFTNLNRALEMVQEGVMVRLTYTGKEKVQTKFGLKDVHQVSVQIDEEDVLDRDIHEETKNDPF